jgi:hypothetical protein
MKEKKEWRVCPRDPSCVISSDSTRIGCGSHKRASHIVKSVNANDALVAACKAAVKTLDRILADDNAHPVQGQLRTALKEAGEL